MKRTTINQYGIDTNFKGKHTTEFELEEIDEGVLSDHPSTVESDSNDEKLSGRPRKKSRISIGGSGFAPSSDRGRTKVGPQVEHVSGYL